MKSLLIDIPNDALQIAFFQMGSSARFPTGWIHNKTVPHGIIALASKGQYEITCARQTVRLKKGEAFLTPAYSPLRIVHHHDNRKCFVSRWLHFSFVLYQTIDITSLLDMPLRLDSRISRQFGSIMDELTKPIAAGGEELMQLAHLARRRELIWSILRMICSISKLKLSARDRLKAGQRLEPLLAYLKSNLSEPISVKQMAGLTHMSGSAFFTFFQKRMGCSPMEYVKRMRLNEAATLFSSTDSLLKEVADRTGFANPFHLSREFKRRFGLSPRAYRELQLPSNQLE